MGWVGIAHGGNEMVATGKEGSSVTPVPPARLLCDDNLGHLPGVAGARPEEGVGVEAEAPNELQPQQELRG